MRFWLCTVASLLHILIYSLDCNKLVTTSRYPNTFALRQLIDDKSAASCQQAGKFDNFKQAAKFDNFKQVGKIDNLLQVCGVFACIHKLNF